MNARGFKDRSYEALAAVTRAFGNARRLELLDLLAQGPRTVDALARATAQPVASASQHLQVLRRASLVETERRGRQIEYRLAPSVPAALAHLRRLAHARSPRLAQVHRDFYLAAGAPETIDGPTLRRRMADGTAVLIDVRPAGEHRAGHIPGALSIPLATLEAALMDPGAALGRLPADALLVATCRGPCCVFAAQAVRTLRAAGRAAVRFEDGVAEWAADGGRLETGAPP